MWTHIIVWTSFSRVCWLYLPNIMNHWTMFDKTTTRHIDVFFSETHCIIALYSLLQDASYVCMRWNNVSGDVAYVTKRPRVTVGRWSYSIVNQSVDTGIYGRHILSRPRNIPVQKDQKTISADGTLQLWCNDFCYHVFMWVYNSFVVKYIDHDPRVALCTDKALTDK